MDKNFWEVSGVNFFEKWILPTNSESKNPIWKKTNTIIGIDHWLKKHSIEHRLQLAYLLWGMHGVVFISLFMIERGISINLILFQLVTNVYPIMVQLKTGLRIKKILENKKLKR